MGQSLKRSKTSGHDTDAIRKPANTYTRYSLKTYILGRRADELQLNSGRLTLSGLTDDGMNCKPRTTS